MGYTYDYPDEDIIQDVKDNGYGLLVISWGIFIMLAMHFTHLVLTKQQHWDHYFNDYITLRDSESMYRFSSGEWKLNSPKEIVLEFNQNPL